MSPIDPIDEPDELTRSIQCECCGDSKIVKCPDCDGEGEICTYYDVCSDTGEFQICDCCGGLGQLECPECYDNR